MHWVRLQIVLRFEQGPNNKKAPDGALALPAHLLPLPGGPWLPVTSATPKTPPLIRSTRAP